MSETHWFAPMAICLLRSMLASIISQVPKTETQKRAHYYIFTTLELNQLPFCVINLPTDFIQQVYANLCLYLHFTCDKNNQHTNCN